MSLSILGHLAIYALLLPVLLILIFRMFSGLTFLMLLLYYFSTAVYNMMISDVIPVSSEIRRIFGVINNYIDAPLMLIALLFFCNVAWMRNTIYVTLGIVIVYELVIASLFGLSAESSVYVLGPGIAIMFVYSAYLFFKHIKHAIVQGKAIGRTLLITAILFSYACFAMIYFFYYIQKTPAIADVFLIYYIVSIISCLIMSAGLIYINRRKKKLKEVQVTRKELAMFFNN